MCSSPCMKLHIITNNIVHNTMCSSLTAGCDAQLHAQIVDCSVRI